MTYPELSDGKPSQEVLDAFGLSGKVVEILARRVYACDGALIKYVDLPTEVIWYAKLAEHLPQNGFYLPKQLISTEGEYIVDGWCAQELMNTSELPKPQAAIAACNSLHHALHSVAKPAFITGIRHCWDQAFEYVWGGSLPNVSQAAKNAAKQIEPHLEPTEVHEQVIHGDLGSNMLATHPPSIIDFSAYWSDPKFALAVLIVDRVARKSEYTNLLASYAHLEQFLLRALLFRIVGHSLHAKNRNRDHNPQRYLEVFEALKASQP